MSRLPDSPLPPPPAETDPTSAYARDVVAGRYVVGRLVRLACERHLRNLEAGAERGLRFDAAEASAAIDFWRLCPHLKGRRWANTPIEPEPWQEFIIGSVYGWKRWDADRSAWLRRFRIAWVETGRKNGKSTFAYPAALHNLTIDGEPGAEVYSVATKKDQSRIVYQMARRAVLRTPELAAVITPFAHSLVVEETWSKFEALGSDSDTMDGLNPSCVICDEVHKWKGRDLWDVIDTATGARDQPLILVVTTAGREGSEDIYGQEHDYTVQVIEGVAIDDSRFGYIACLDPGDDWTDEKNFPKANPNLGVSVRVEEIREAVNRAKASPAAAAAVKRLRLGIRSQDEDAWLPLPLWDAGRAEDLDWERYRGAACGAGLDLASSCDFAAFATAFPVDEDLATAREFDRPWGYLFRWRLWLPEGFKTNGERKLRDLVRPWVAAGWVELTDGDAIDHEVIEERVKEDARTYDIRRLCYDPYNATQLSVHLQEAGVPVEQFRQGMATFAEPTKRFDGLVNGKRLRHDGNPCVRWMADNCVLVTNAAGHRMPSRKKSKNKIDGIVAGVMALGACLVPIEGGYISSNLVTA